MHLYVRFYFWLQFFHVRKQSGANVSESEARCYIADNIKVHSLSQVLKDTWCLSQCKSCTASVFFRVELILWMTHSLMVDINSKELSVSNYAMSHFVFLHFLFWAHKLVHISVTKYNASTQMVNSYIQIGNWNTGRGGTNKRLESRESGCYRKHRTTINTIINLSEEAVKEEEKEAEEEVKCCNILCKGRALFNLKTQAWWMLCTMQVSSQCTTQIWISKWGHSIIF